MCRRKTTFQVISLDPGCFASFPLLRTGEYSGDFTMAIDKALISEKLESLGDRLLACGNRPSGFDYMRLALASMVIVSHTFQVSYGKESKSLITASFRTFGAPILPMFLRPERVPRRGESGALPDADLLRRAACRAACPRPNGRNCSLGGCAW